VPSCLRGREVKIRLRSKFDRSRFNDYTLICPTSWTRARFQKYVRGEHPNETLRILDWGESGWEPTHWIVNPQAM
jgi:hypothetical protein